MRPSEKILATPLFPMLSVSSQASLSKCKHVEFLINKFRESSLVDKEKCLPLDAGTRVCKKLCSNKAWSKVLRWRHNVHMTNLNLIFYYVNCL